MNKLFHLVQFLWVTMMMMFFPTREVSSLSLRRTLRKRELAAGRGKELREQVVRTYFAGVQKQNRDQIVSCFSPEGTKITDVCGLSSGTRIATPFELGERCMEFLAAHPDTVVKFHYEPRCGRGDSKWVFAHWYETGTWKGYSMGIEPDGSKLDVQGQTRFLVDDNLKITEMVVTRTFSEWEKQLQAKLAEKEKAKQSTAVPTE